MSEDQALNIDYWLGTLRVVKAADKDGYFYHVNPNIYYLYFNKDTGKYVEHIAIEADTEREAAIKLISLVHPITGTLMSIPNPNYPRGIK